MQTTLDPITTPGAMFPLGLRPEHWGDIPAELPAAVSFGFSQTTAMPDDGKATPNLTYCDKRQILVIGDGTPAYTITTMAMTDTTKTTTADMQKFPDADSDRTSVK